MSTEDISAIYDYITEYIKSPMFRTEVKDFVDDNCGTFFGEDENSFQQYALHKEFKLLIENLLEKMLSEIGATQELFLLVAKKGLEHIDDKKYYEQLIACDNYVYFKNMMIKRNLQLEEQALQLMQEQNLLKGKSNQELQTDPSWKELQRIREETELECAIQMSLAIEEERKKLMELEEEELMRAIELSKLSLNSGSKEDDLEKEISLHDPTTLINKNKESDKLNQIQVKNNIDINLNLNVNKNRTSITSSSASSFQNQKPDIQIISKKENNLDMAFYGGSNSISNHSNDQKINKNYVDMVIDKTEKIKFDHQDSKTNVGITPKNSFAEDNNNLKISPEMIDVNFQPEMEVQVPRNLNQIKIKTYQGDRTFLLQNQKIDTTDIKSKIAETNESNKEILNNLEGNKDELTMKYEELQKEKNEKLKEYREMLLKMKKEKRNTEKEKDDPFDIDESKLSDEVKKRLQMRKQLAESLKNKNI